MVLASEKSAPKFSIGKCQRKNLYEFSETPGPIYSFFSSFDSRHISSPQWKIGSSPRTTIRNGEIYEYAKIKYERNNDLSLLPHAWRRIPGGACVLARRGNSKVSDCKPGPGRYDPKVEVRSQSVRPPSFVMGLRTENEGIFNNEGAGKNVAPWTYKQDMFGKLSIHPSLPSYSFQHSKRKDLAAKPSTKKESYFLYSSLGAQIMAQKPTMPANSMPKETREGRKKTGIFKSMMERNPKSVRISMPKM